jgi:hypothetical protein
MTRSHLSRCRASCRQAAEPRGLFSLRTPRWIGPVGEGPNRERCPGAGAGSPWRRRYRRINPAMIVWPRCVSEGVGSWVGCVVSRGCRCSHFWLGPWRPRWCWRVAPAHRDHRPRKRAARPSWKPMACRLRCIPRPTFVSCQTILASPSAPTMARSRASAPQLGRLTG